MLIHGDARDLPLADASVQCVVTSPPYWGLRDYGLAPSVWGADEACAHVWGEERYRTSQPDRGNSGGLSNPQPRGEQSAAAARGFDVSTGAFCTRCPAWRGVLGLEPTPELYVQHLVQCFREVRRVLRADGTVWLNLGDSYFATGRGPSDLAPDRGFHTGVTRENFPLNGNYRHATLKQKDLVGIPWRVAFALQQDGWYLRADVIWAKPNPMPESVTDRPTKAHEYLFLLAKQERYFYDAEAVRESATCSSRPETSADHDGLKRDATQAFFNSKGSGGNRGGTLGWNRPELGRNRRSVWTIATEPYPEAHFATFPEALVAPCILAGARLGDVVLDPFAGTATVGAVAERLGRVWVGVDLKPEYLALARKRTAQRGLRFTEWRPAVQANGNGHGRMRQIELVARL
jgi:DNA modification methylase